MSPGRVVAPLALLLVAGSLAAVLWWTPSSGGARPETLLTLAEIAEYPASLAGRTVTFAGEVAPSDYFSPADAFAAIVVGDGAGHRVLVRSATAGLPPRRLTRGSRVRITGRVSDAEPRAPDADGRPDLSTGALLARAGATAAVRAEAVVPSRDLAELDRGQPRIRRTTIRRLLRRPRSFGRETIAVSGRARSIGPYGFVLTDGRWAIFVAARPSDLRPVTDGERIRVRGALARISRFRADTIAATTSARAAPRRGARRAPSRPGRPFVLLRELSGA